MLPRADIAAGRRADRPRLLGRAFQRLFAGAPAGRGREARLGRAGAVRAARTLGRGAAGRRRASTSSRCWRRSARDRARIKALAHITGGGLSENVPRVLPDGLRRACRPRRRGRRPPCSAGCAQAGSLDDAEMLRTFNCGIGMVVVVGSQQADAVLTALQGAARRRPSIGEIEPGRGVKSSRQGQRRGRGRAVLEHARASRHDRSASAS